MNFWPSDRQMFYVIWLNSYFPDYTSLVQGSKWQLHPQNNNFREIAQDTRQC